MSYGLAVAFRKINYDAVLTNLLKDLLTVGLMAIAYHAGKYFSCFYSKRWANYLIVYFGIAALTLIGWTTYGTHIEDADPLYGSGNRVVDFNPTDRERSDQAGAIFFGLIPAALYGVYRGQNDSERHIKKRFWQQ